MRKYVLIDIGGTYIKYSLATEDGDLLDKEEVDTPIQGRGETLNVLIEIIKEYQKKHSISGVALSVPGGIDDDGYIHFMGTVKDLTGIYLGELIREETGLDSAYDNDVNCVALAEKFKGNAIDNDNFVCMTIGTGIGCGIFVNGELYRGYRGMAGECGITILKYDAPLNPQANEKYWFSNLGATKAMSDKATECIGYPLNGKEVFQLAALGNQKVKGIIGEFYQALAVGIHNLVYTLAPEKILIGGGISGREELISEVKKYLSLLREETLDLVEIDRCKFQNDAGKLGALYLLLKKQGRL